MLANIRSGAWLTSERLRVYPLILLGAYLLAIALVLAQSHGRLGPDGQPLGTDFSQVWVAGLETLRGHPSAPFDIATHAAEQRAEFGSPDAVYGWHYPPYFLLPAALLAKLPYLQALLLWQLGTLALCLLIIAKIAAEGGLDGRKAALTALAFPAMIINFGHGQNGFLTAALLGGGFLLLERRPVIAGALFALLAYKPQFALALPVALIFGREWRALFSAAATLILLTALTTIFFGVEAWSAFFRNLPFTQHVVIEQGAAGFAKIQSVFAAMRLAGASVGAAYMVQGAVAVAALATVALAWSSSLDRPRKYAIAIVATLLTTPYCLDYDMTVLAPAGAFLIGAGLKERFLPYEKTALAAAFLAPLVARPVASMVPVGLGVVAIGLIFFLAALHIHRASRLPAHNALA